MQHSACMRFVICTIPMEVVMVMMMFCPWLLMVDSRLE